MENWVNRHSSTLIFLFGAVVVLSLITLVLQFPKELRGGAFTRLDSIIIEQRKFRKDITEELHNLSNEVAYRDKLLDNMIHSMYRMRNDF